MFASLIVIPEYMKKILEINIIVDQVHPENMKNVKEEYWINVILEIIKFLKQGYAKIENFLQWVNLT